MEVANSPQNLSPILLVSGMMDKISSRSKVTLLSVRDRLGPCVQPYGALWRLQGGSKLQAAMFMALRLRILGIWAFEMAQWERYLPPNPMTEVPAPRPT